MASYAILIFVFNVQSCNDLIIHAYFESSEIAEIHSTEKEKKILYDKNKTKMLQPLFILNSTILLTTPAVAED